MCNNNYEKWFIGFSEGDASWSIVKRSSKLVPVFTINQKDPKILYKIKSFLGFGSVKGPYQNKNNPNKYYRYYVSGVTEHTRKLIEIFNGNLILKKTQKRFENYVAAYNNLIDPSQRIVLKKPTKTKISLKNGWLSGFIDAEGCFIGHMRKDHSRGSIKMILGQTDEETVLRNLNKLLVGSYLTKPNVRKHIVLTVARESSRAFLIEYLDKYPLKSSKQIAFTRFKKLHIRFTDGLFKWRLLQPKSKARIARLIQNINTDL